MNITYSPDLFADGLARRFDGRLHSSPIFGRGNVSKVSAPASMGIIRSHTNLEFKNLAVEADDFALSINNQVHIGWMGLRLKLRAPRPKSLFNDPIVEHEVGDDGKAFDCRLTLGVRFQQQLQNQSQRMGNSLIMIASGRVINVTETTTWSLGMALMQETQ
jgi:hypothetical protein